MKKSLIAGIALGLVMGLENHLVRAASSLMIDDQTEVLSLATTNLQLTLTGSYNLPPTNPPFTLHLGAVDFINLDEVLIGGVFNFSGIWPLTPGTAPTAGSFAQVAYDPDGSVSDLLTWSVASAGTGPFGTPLASLSGTFCSALQGGPFPCAIPAYAVTVGEGPNTATNQDLAITWTSDAEPILEPGSTALLAAAITCFGLMRRRVIGEAAGFACRDDPVS